MERFRRRASYPYTRALGARSAKEKRAMKKFLFILALLFTFAGSLHAQVLTGYRIKFSPTDNFSFPASGTFISPEGKLDTLYLVVNGVHHLLFPQTGTAGSFISTIVDSGRNWTDIVKSNDTLYLVEIFYADSAGNSHKTDTLVNVFQNVWKRTSSGIVSLVFPGDSIVAGGTYDATLLSKFQIPASNSLVSLAFTQASGASVDAFPIWGRMNNDDLWRIAHYGGTDTWRLEYVQNPGGTTPVYLSMNPSGIGVNTPALDLFTVAGNATIGGFTSGLTGNHNFRTRGFIYAGIQGTETNTIPSNVFNTDNPTNDIVVFSTSTQIDSTGGTHDAFFGHDLAPFTSASAQTVFSYTLNWNTTYVWQLRALMRPSSKTGEYFSKEIYVTASNDSGTVVFDTTTIASHLKDPFGVFATCDFVVTTSGNAIVFQVKGSATRETHFIVTGNRSYTK